MKLILFHSVWTCIKSDCFYVPYVHMQERSTVHYSSTKDCVWIRQKTLKFLCRFPLDIFAFNKLHYILVKTTTIYMYFQFSEIRDKYALAQKEISQLNTELQDALYELQKANHRVDNLVKRLNELEDVNKRLRDGNTAPGEQGDSGPAQVKSKWCMVPKQTLPSGADLGLFNGGG